MNDTMLSNFNAILLRHGETPDTNDGLISGQRDVPLSESGKKQAQAVAWKLARLGIAHIVCSDLQRARETAMIVARTLGLPEPQCDPRLRERHWGARQGTPRRNKPSIGDDLAPPGGESLQQLRDRVFRTIQGLAPRTLVVAHAGPIRVVLEYFGRSIKSVEPCGFVDFNSEGEAGPETDFLVEGHVISGGLFSGRVKYVAEANDLVTVDKETLVILQSCSKSVAVEAVERGTATINMTRSLTAHLTHGRISETPYAIGVKWPHGVPREGQRVRLEFKTRPRRRSRTLLPDVEPVQIEQTEGIGGKAAGLLLLEQQGVNVPPFCVIGTDEIANWRGRDLRRSADLWVERTQLDRDMKWVVRSSADVEDRPGNPMSGSFLSRLNCSVEQLPAAIADVEASARSSEIQRRLAQDNLADEPRMAIVIQQMIEHPRLSGTVFLPAPREPDRVLIEAVLEKTAESLMDGTEHPDVAARCDVDANPVHVEFSENQRFTRAWVEAIVRRIARGALAIYGNTGRGDIEFAVDRDEQLWWLQARVLNDPVEIVDRRGFHPAAVTYYKSLAFRVAEANLTPPPFFRCFDLADGVFGYSVGIRHRDRLFHEAIKQNPKHLDHVTAFGWEVERRMSETVSELDATHSDDVLDLLTLHGAVQLPFSIPISSHLMDRFQSEATDIVAEDAMFENFLDSVMERLGTNTNRSELLSLLRLPTRTVAAIEILQATLELLRASEPSDEMLFRRLVFDLRDVPNVSPAARAELRRKTMHELLRIRQDDPDGTNLAKEIRCRRAAFQDLQQRRTQLLDLARNRLNENDWMSLDRWARYLRMKAETNETHCLYRGRCFLWLAHIGYS